MIRTAVSFFCMCWPPAPCARKVSMFRSFAFIVISATASMSGKASTIVKDVCRLFAESKGEIRTSRCTPRSARKYPNA